MRPARRSGMQAPLRRHASPRRTIPHRPCRRWSESSGRCSHRRASVGSPPRRRGLGLLQHQPPARAEPRVVEAEAVEEVALRPRELAPGVAAGPAEMQPAGRPPGLAPVVSNRGGSAGPTLGPAPLLANLYRTVRGRQSMEPAEPAEPARPAQRLAPAAWVGVPAGE